jgi:hypothetical protein
MPPFRTSWLYLVSPFTLQRYEVFLNIPNYSGKIYYFSLLQALGYIISLILGAYGGATLMS